MSCQAHVRLVKIPVLLRPVGRRMKEGALRIGGTAVRSSQAERTRNRHLSICESAREKAQAMGFNKGRDEKLHMGEARGGRATSSLPSGRQMAHLRQSAFVGLRDDKDPREVVREGR